ncbi:MAG: pentapeptide repeat-containing protein [Planctomycetes bacterium]|nr:pentapeptide repeat-containing protein [Planctomycetota bacterium]
MIKTILTLTALVLALCSTTVTRADIFEWEYIDPADPGQGKRESSTLVPGGAGRDAVPGADLNGRNLTRAYLIDTDLSHANFRFATLTDADLTGAEIFDANLSFTTFRGFTASQLYSTASYQLQNLSSIKLQDNNLSGWDFSKQNLHKADFRSALLTDANLNQANLADTNFDSASLLKADLKRANLTNANFSFALLTNSDIKQAKLTNATFNFAMLNKADLSQVNATNAFFIFATLLNANLRQANLSKADFNRATLTDADLTGAKILGTNFANTTSNGFTESQLYSTASYRSQNLSGIGMFANNLNGWNFAGQNLTNAIFDRATLTNTDLTGAEVRWASFWGATFVGFTASQLYSTSSYQSQDLTGISLSRNDLSGWNFSGLKITNADISRSTLTNADLSGADLRGTFISNLNDAIVSNLIGPDGIIDGLNLSGGQTLLVRDYDGNPDAFTPIDSIPLTVEQQFVMEAGGNLQLRFEADAWGSTISFAPGIPVALGGTLSLEFAADVELGSQVGRTLDLFDWTGVVPTGAFTVESPYVWDLSELYSTGEATLLAIPEPSTSLLLLFAAALLFGSHLHRIGNHSQVHEQQSNFTQR